MTFTEKLNNHIGCLLRLKTKIYWFDLELWTDAEETLVLLLEVDSDDLWDPLIIDAETHSLWVWSDRGIWQRTCVLMNEKIRYIQICEKDIEFIENQKI
jgi:hypothetical protein